MNDEKELIEFTPSSGNIFLDLGLTDPETRLLKAKILGEITKLIKAQDLTSEQLAAKLNLSDAELVAIIEIKSSILFLETLLICLKKLGKTLEIKAKDIEEQSLVVS